MANEHVSDLDFVDDLYLSAMLADESDNEDNKAHYEIDNLFPVSDAKYAEGLHFQEALMSSVIISRKRKITNANIKTNPPSVLVVEPPLQPNTPIETGQSSPSFCEICAERKETNRMFETDSCVHNSFCCDCISKHVSTRIKSSITIVTCPGFNCRSVLELDFCRTKLSKGVIDLWEEVLCREVISAEEIFYCPFKDCSAMLVNDNDGGQVIRESECPFCHRLFCAQCHVPWHSGVECEVFQNLNEDERGREDLMVMEIAKEKKWSRCPKCKFFVERTEGCPHMTCRCNFQFCYGCGIDWNKNSHGGCQRN